MLPAEGDLRRVIGDGEAIPDGEVEGLSGDDLVALYRGIVLLRTYDERSVVYHRQGRIGTYAIFWNHEAMQAGAVFALADRDWVFPAYRESAIGLLRGMPVSTVLSWWRGHPAGWWDPTEFNVASICVPIATQIPHAVGFAWGSALKGEDRVALTLFGDGATSEGAFHEGATFAGVMKAPVVLFCNNNQWAISTPIAQQTAAPTLADKAIGYGMPGVRVDGGTCSRSTRRRATRCSEREQATGRRSSRPSRIAPRHTRPRTIPRSTSIPSGSRRRGRTSASAASSVTCFGSASSPRSRRRRSSRRRSSLMRAGIAAAEAEPPADPSLVFEHAYADPPPSLLRRAATSCGGSSVAERLLVEAVNDALHVEMERDPSILVMGEDVGKLGGVFRATAGLQERFGADRCVDTPLAEAGILGTAVGLCMAGWRPVVRDAVRRVQLPVARSADQPRRSLPLADARARCRSR